MPEVRNLDLSNLHVSVHRGGNTDHKRRWGDYGDDPLMGSRPGGGGTMDMTP